MSETKKRRGGRPLLHPDEGRRQTVTFRIRPGLEALIRRAAADGGFSFSEETERRLERSFVADEMRDIIRQELRASLHLDEQPEPYINQSAPPH